MRAMAIVSWIILLFTGVGCNKNVPSEPLNAQPDAHSRETSLQKPEVSPRLWWDEAASEMVKVALGYDQPDDAVYVFRWEHDAMHGNVELESKDGSGRVSHELSVPSGPEFWRMCGDNAEYDRGGNGP